ncbi:MAG: dienelactone hydrolase family protein [Betaproteobacteria bacterium]
MGTMIELAAADGFRLTAYRAAPAGVARGGLVVAQEIFGVNSHIKAVCDGFAADGYLAIAPALFDRYKSGIDLGYGPDDIAAGRELKAEATIEPALQDVEAARTAASAAGRVGIVGYCWGGFVAWASAAGLDGLACAVPYYGGGMIDTIGLQPKCPVMMHFGELDTMIPVAGVQRLAAAHPAARVFIYPANHGFNCDQRASFDAASAALARERTLAFFRTHIG